MQAATQTLSNPPPRIATAEAHPFVFGPSFGDCTLLPPRDLTESVRVVRRERHCVEYTVRNIRLMETLSERNDLTLYFAESPARAREAPGPFRIAQLPIRFIPPAIREPTGAMITVLDEEFVHYPRRETE